MNDAKAEAAQGVQAGVSFRHELMRKGIHLMSLSIPVVYTYIPKRTALWIVVPMTLVFAIADTLRSFHAPTFRLYTRIFGRMLREHEKDARRVTFNGATWVLISATLCVALFPKVLAITAFAILIISDTTAALVGRRFGTRHYRGKSLQGSTAFVLSAALVVFVTPKIAHLPAEYVIGIVGGIVGALAEIFSFDIIDDNFAIPIAIGAAMWLMYLLFLPALNVHLLDV